MEIRLSLPRFLQQIHGGGGGDNPIAIHLSEERPFVILPPYLAILCVACALAGALGRVLMENKRGQRGSRANWNTFGVCAIFGTPGALAAAEALFRTQPWARDSSAFLCMLAVVIGSGGQGFAMEASESVRDATKLLAAKGKQVLGAVFSPVKDDKP